MESALPRFFVLVLPAALSVFVSFAELLAAAVKKSRLKLKSAREPVLSAAEHPEMLICALRIWNLAARAAAACLAVFFFGDRAVPCLIILALALLVFSELLPRAAIPPHPETAFVFLFPLISLLCLPWKPLCAAISRIASSRNGNEETGDAEFRLALEEGEKSGAVESRERSMVEGVLYLGDRPAGAFMTHRSEIQCLDINADGGEILKKVLAFRSQGFFPVVRETRDNIAGIVLVEDILAAFAEHHQWKGLSAVMKAPRFIPETMSALKAFEAFRRENERYLCVMDEYGGFAGTLGIPNLLEEIVGGLAGPAQEAEALVRQEDGVWLADGGVSVDELSDLPGLESLGGGSEYHTLAGFILKLAGDIPRRGDCFTWGGYVFTVTELDGNRIGKVTITLAPG